MKILNTRVFEGRNIYSHKKCVKLDVNLEGYSEIPSKEIGNFNNRLVEYIPELKLHRCGIDEEGGFIKRLKEGTYLAHICEHIIISLQNRLGIEVCYGKAREVEGEFYYIIYEYEYKKTAIECAVCAVELINSLINRESFDIERRMENIKNIFMSEELGPSTLSILNEAKKRGIPYIKIGEGSMFQLGYGKYSKMIEATICSDTSNIGVDIACDKLLTKEILNNQCLPVARGGKVNSIIDLLLEAKCIGYPVVLKPRYGNQGNGVFVNIKDEVEAAETYRRLKEEYHYNDILIEKYIKGRDYRVCMVNGNVVAVAERIPPFVIGDGKKTINELIDELNNDPKRGEGHEKPLTRLKIDKEVIKFLSQHNYVMESILKNGEKVYLRQNCNLSTGGIAEDCTYKICKENIEICERCAKAINLDICGIDICCSDISRPIDDGAIIEVNAAPGIRMHHYPSVGEKQNVASSIIDMLFNKEAKSIPIIAVTGTNGKTTTTRLISHVLQMMKHDVGMTSTGGIYINNKCIDTGDTTGYDSAKTILTNREIDAAVLECARGGLIKGGLAYDLADVGIITNITDDHLGIDGIDSMEELAHVKSLVWEAVKKDGNCIVNGDDKVSVSIVNNIKSHKIIFSKYEDNVLLRKNIECGGIGVYINKNIMYVENSEGVFPIVKVSDIKITLNGVLTYNVENALAACAGLVGLGVDYVSIGRGLSSFCGDESSNPGRFNMYKIKDSTVVLDYGHNIEGYKAVLSGAKQLKHKRLVGIIGVPGDRNDICIKEVGKIAGSNFDYIYIKEDKDRRGRKAGEISKLLQTGVMDGGLNQNNIEIILDEEEALKTAINNALSGDLIIIFFEQYKPLLDIVKQRMIDEKVNKEVAIMA